MGALSSVFSHLGTSIMNQFTDAYSKGRALERDKELSRYNFDLEKQLWNEANAYNSPSAQMERYRQAGLNPNLVYTQSNLASANPTAGGNASSAQNVPISIMPMVDAYTRLKQMQLYEAQVEKDIEAKDIDNKNKVIEGAIKQLDYNKGLEESHYYGVNARYQSEEFAAKARKANQELADLVFKLETLNPIKEQQERELLRGYQLQNTLRGYEKEEAEFKKGNYKFLNDMVQTLKDKFPHILGKGTKQDAQQLWDIWRSLSNPTSLLLDFLFGGAKLPDFK